MERAQQQFQIFATENFAFISIITVAELRSLAGQRNWGTNLIEKLNAQLRKIPQMDINKQLILEKYVEIDLYNLSKHPTLKLPGSARTVGDNDCWIAATAAALNATLITTDHDFDHLNGIFFDVIWLDPR